MKILFLHALAEPELGGGAEVTLWTLMRGLRDAGHQCVLLATSEQRGLTRSERDGIAVWQAGIRNLHWPYGAERRSGSRRALWHLLDIYNPLMQGYLREVVGREAPDVVSAHNLPGWSVASWRTLAGLGVPSVQVLHDFYAVCARSSLFRAGRNCQSQCMRCRMLRLPHRALSRRLHGVVGVSQYVLDAHRALGYFNGVRIQRVIHNARDAGALGIPAGRGPGRSRLRFGYIGRLDPAKGVDRLIDAFKSIGAEEAELWIAGTGDARYRDQLAGRVGNSPIRLIGRAAPADLYSQVDIVVVPSVWNEPLGMVVAEAFAFGKPVIGSRRGGIPEMIRDGENGLLFEPDAPGELAARLAQVARDASLREHLSANAQLSGRRFVDTAAWARAYEEVYAGAQGLSGR